MYGDKGEVPDGEYIPIGVADIKREGTDVTIVSFGKL
jgi:pyruvate dehydrogenase E1 component beta subunit